MVGTQSWLSGKGGLGPWTRAEYGTIVAKADSSSAIQVVLRAFGVEQANVKSRPKDWIMQRSCGRCGDQGTSFAVERERENTTKARACLEKPERGGILGGGGGRP